MILTFLSSIKIMSRKIRYVKIYVINFVLPTQRIMIYSQLLFRWAWYVRDNLANKIMIKFAILSETEIRNGCMGSKTYVIRKGVI